MSIQAGVGISKNKNAREAGIEATKEALARGALERADVLIAFASVSFNQDELVVGIREAGGEAVLFGCTDAGEITGAGPSEKSVAVMAIKSDTIRFTAGLGEGVKEKGAREAGRMSRARFASACRETSARLSCSPMCSRGTARTPYAACSTSSASTSRWSAERRVTATSSPGTASASY